MKAEDLARYRKNVVAFAEHVFYVPGPDGRPRLIRLEPHQKAILRHTLTPGRGGRFPYTTILNAEPKKSGKSTISGVVGLWMALRERNAEVYALANDLDQSLGRVFKAILYAVRHNPMLKRAATILRRTVTFKATGSVIEALPSEYAGAAGSNPSCTLWDELWGYTSERSQRLWDEMTPVPTRLNSIRWVGSYAGFLNESRLLEGLHDRGLAGQRLGGRLKGLPCYRDGTLFVYWSHEPRMPWQTPEYYAEQRKDLRPNAYLRLHENRWVSAESAFISPEAWDACILKAYRCPSTGPELVVGLDIGIKHDFAAAVGVFKDNGDVWVGPYRVWRPSPVVDLESVLQYLIRLRADFGSIHVVCDPWQAQHMIQRLSRIGMSIDEFPQTQSGLTRAGNTLFEMIRERHLVVWEGADELREHVLNAQARETPRGIRLVKSGRGKIDAAIALAMAVTTAHTVRHFEKPGVVRYA